MADECDCLESCRLDDWSDQFVPATRELLIFTKSAKRYFDLDAVRKPSKTGNRVMWQSESTDGSKVPGNTKPRRNEYVANNPLGSPPLDWWCIDPDQSSALPERKGDPMTATFYVGDAIEVMGKLPEKSVDLILTSPPFLALRSYLPANHPDKALEGGSQATPGAFIDWLVDVVEACDRILAPHGSMCIELGDTYAGSGGENHLYEGSNPAGGFNGSADFGTLPTPKRIKTGWPLAKSLSLIPELFRLTLVYGTNPLTGRQTDRWRLRNVVRWVRPNPPVGALGDKFRPATSELMVFCKSAKRYFDLDAVRTDHKRDYSLEAGAAAKRLDKHNAVRAEVGLSSRSPSDAQVNPAGAPPLDWWNIPLTGEPCQTCGGVGWFWTDAKHSEGGKTPCPSCNGSGIQGAERYGPKPRDITKGIPNKALAHSPTKGNSWGPDETKIMYENPAGAPPLDWWNIPPGGYEGAHYAVFPPELCIKPIKAMSPERVCRQCGEPSRRITEVDGLGGRDFKAARTGVNDRDTGLHGPRLPMPTITRTTTDWTDCGHGSIVCQSCKVLVPYDHAIQRSRGQSPVQGGVGQEEVLGEPGEGSGLDAEASEGVPDLRGGLLGSNGDKSSLQPLMFGEAGASGRADEHAATSPKRVGASASRRTEGSDLRSGLGSGGLPGTTSERLDDGASGADAGASRPPVGVVGVGPPSERQQDGQPDRESTDSEPRPTERPGDLSELPASLRGSLAGYVCSCGSTDFGYVADHWRPGLVLDPFGGSGTTALVATGHGRDCILIDLDERNFDLALQRVGPFILERAT